MVRSSSSNFVDIVIIGERIEGGLKIRKIVDGDSQSSASRRASGGYTNKKEEETMQ